MRRDVLRAEHARKAKQHQHEAQRVVCGSTICRHSARCAQTQCCGAFENAVAQTPYRHACRACDAPSTILALSRRRLSQSFFFVLTTAPLLAQKAAGNIVPRMTRRFSAAKTNAVKFAIDASYAPRHASNDRRAFSGFQPMHARAHIVASVCAYTTPIRCLADTIGCWRRSRDCRTVVD